MPLPKPKGSQKKFKGTEMKSETVKGERTQGNVFFYGNVSLNLIKAV